MTLRPVIGSITFGPSVSTEVRSSLSSFSKLYQDAVSQSASGINVHQQTRNNYQVGGVLPIGKKRLRVMPTDSVDNLNVCAHATYVRCSGHEDFANVIRVYDANNFSVSNFSHHHALSLKVRFHRACRAFVNAWRAS